MVSFTSRNRITSRAAISMSVACPCAPPLGSWSSTPLCGSAVRRPGAPAASSTAAIDAACPAHTVATSGPMNCIVS